MEKVKRKKFEEEWDAEIKEVMERVEKRIEQQKNTQLKVNEPETYTYHSIMGETVELPVAIDETFPPHKHFFIKDEETIPSGYVKYMNETYGDVLENTQKAMNKVKRFLGKVEEVENGQRVIYTQKLPEISDLPDWLVVEEEPKLTNVPKSLETYTLVFDAILCSGKYLTPLERLLWMMVRKRVPNKELHGYWKEAALPTYYEEFADWLGVKKLTIIRTFKKLKKKGLIRLEGESRKVQKIWLVDLNKWLSERELKPIKRGFIRSVLVPEGVLDAIKKKFKK